MPPQPIFSNRLRHGNKPASPAAERQALNAGSPEVVSGQGAPIAQGLSSGLKMNRCRGTVHDAGYPASASSATI